MSTMEQNGGGRASAGCLDVVIDGVLYRATEIGMVMVESGDDLASLPAYPPGSYAFTAGCTAMWQLGTDGTWVQMIGGE